MAQLEPQQILALHRQLVGIQSLSHHEGAIADWIQQYLEGHGATVERLGDNIIARAGSGPRLLMNSHFDTVPPGDGWTRGPWDVTVDDGHVFGLGSNDAKASVAAMIAAFLCVADNGGPCEVVLLLVPEEETGGQGAEIAWPHIRDAGFVPSGVIVGEPTNLDIAIAQKGLMILELVTHGDGGHSAHAAALGSRNAIRELARDLVALETFTLGDNHPLLGSTSIEPTIAEGGIAKNKVPDVAQCTLDLRTVPDLTHDEIIERVSAAVTGDIRVSSSRLVPRACDPEAPVVLAAREARPSAELFGSRTLSDLVYFDGVDAIKCGPGRTERSHQPDEYVLESEILEGAQFYSRWIEQFAKIG